MASPSAKLLVPPGFAFSHRAPKPHGSGPLGSMKGAVMSDVSSPARYVGQVPIWVQHPETTLRYWVDGVMLPAALNAAGLTDHVEGMVTSQSVAARSTWIREAARALESGIRWGAARPAGRDALGPALGAAMRHSKTTYPAYPATSWRVVMLAASKLWNLIDRDDRLEQLRRPEPTISWVPADAPEAAG